MARYSELYLGDELIKLRDGLDVLETHGLVDYGEINEMNLWLYGIVTDASVLDYAKEALISGEEFMDDNGEPTVGEGDMELSEIAIAVQIKGSGTVDALYRGYPLRDLEFAYQSGEGEGVRTSNFYNSHSAYNSSSASIKLDKLSTQALAHDEGDLSAYLQEKGKGTPMQVRKKVQRTEEATVDAPHIAEPPPAETPEPAQTVASLLEDFLG